MSENNQNNQPKHAGNDKTQDLNQLRKVRREKLAELIAAGENPYEEVTRCPSLIV